MLVAAAMSMDHQLGEEHDMEMQESKKKAHRPMMVHPRPIMHRPRPIIHHPPPMMIKPKKIKSHKG